MSSSSYSTDDGFARPLNMNRNSFGALWICVRSLARTTFYTHCHKWCSNLLFIAIEFEGFLIVRVLGHRRRNQKFVDLWIWARSFRLTSKQCSNRNGWAGVLPVAGCVYACSRVRCYFFSLFLYLFSLYVVLMRVFVSVCVCVCMRWCACVVYAGICLASPQLVSEQRQQHQQ